MRASRQEVEQDAANALILSFLRTRSLLLPELARARAGGAAAPTSGSSSGGGGLKRKKYPPCDWT